MCVSDGRKYGASPQKTASSDVEREFQGDTDEMNPFFKESAQNQSPEFLPEGVDERILGVLTGLQPCTPE